MPSPCGNVFSSLSRVDLTSAGVNHQKDVWQWAGSSAQIILVLYGNLAVRQGDSLHATRYVIKYGRALSDADSSSSISQYTEEQRLLVTAHFPKDIGVYLYEKLDWLNIMLGENVHPCYFPLATRKDSKPLAFAFCAHFKLHTLKKLDHYVIRTVHLLQIFCFNNLINVYLYVMYTDILLFFSITYFIHELALIVYSFIVIFVILILYIYLSCHCLFCE